MSWIVVGVDCATQEERTGLAYGVLDDAGVLELRRATLGTAGESAPATVAGWIAGAARYVVALDAPLGWPAALGSSLAAHAAGEFLEALPEHLFRRETDRFVHTELGKVPLEVGADRIARTARAALDLLRRARQASSLPLQLAWRPGDSSGVIEVSPLATLLSRGIRAGGYHGNAGPARKARAKILDRIANELGGTVSRDLLIENEHLLDAALSALAAADFARGDAIRPGDPVGARKEGWIWFRGRGQRALFE